MDRASIPAKVRAAVMRRARGRCEDCGAKTALELHHLRYTYFHGNRADWEESIFGHETEHDLDALCRRCHHARHIDPAGDFWGDPEEMATYWATSERGRE